ncbi:recombinase family protein, partial [Bdellovibrionota bacterium FG-2]
MSLSTGNKNKRGWGLIRVSTKEQAEVQHGSPEQQSNMLKRWAISQSEKGDCDFVIERIISEEVSGTKKTFDKRMGLQELRRACRAKAIDFIVIEKLDRLGRYQIGNQITPQEAAAPGVEVYEMESGLINLRDRGNRLGFNIKNMLAEEYSLDLEEKIAKKVREARVNNGKDNSTRPILGLDPHPTRTGVYLINPDEQRIVVDMFESFLKHGSSTALINYCKEKGYKSREVWTKQKIDRSGNIIPPRKIGGTAFDLK